MHMATKGEGVHRKRICLKGGGGESQTIAHLN